LIFSPICEANLLMKINHPGQAQRDPGSCRLKPICEANLLMKINHPGQAQRDPGSRNSVSVN